ncbi:dephospho-CoA kinase [Lysinibacillus sphaericus]|uniref:Dephospho-CoA kinase n=2 Tax=Lysinibacillus TaxID=400634 RepID=A0A2S0JXZ2_LYSSH|nr:MULTISPECIES: dephospho-CoA kinase [Lysinibacillus]AVK95918.1 dephospho-CoA kinase [Lysinibacillus sphaericus]MED4544996.1 dephospho-CoA kinase [Lysinibacillus sphaericus]TKI21652.1 dephospho-CoA kinase [Lysinibacillus sphaericus]TKI49785.1 dephospho-CoA kinase [Lysinibacillus tabacifolii]UDK97955.1 dephospho-CoA kinase [Lysinibacillus sphaericus]
MIIGLTGSIASGKSTVAKMMTALGLPIVDADVVARDVVEPGTETLALIVQNFGADILLEDGNLNRPKLGDIIFHEPAKRKILNDIMHPAIRQEMLRQRDAYIEAGQKHVVMDIPLLFESKLEHFVERILVVSVSEEVQLRRLMERNQLSKEDALARMHSQLPMSVKEKSAHAVIYNNENLQQTEEQLKKILTHWGVL